MPCLIIPNVMVTFPEHQTGDSNVLNLCLSGKLGGVPSLLKMGQICLLAIASALSEQHAPEVIPLDKSAWKEWTLCLPANLIPPLSTAKSWRQRESPGKFTRRFSPHCWLEENTAEQSPADEDRGDAPFPPRQKSAAPHVTALAPIRVKDVFMTEMMCRPPAGTGASALQTHLLVVL